MQDFRKRRSLKAEIPRIAMGSAGVALLAIVAFFSVRGAYHMYQKFTDANDAQSAAQAQLASLQSQYSTVSAQVANLQTSEGTEAQLRERYGVALPGEGEIDIVTQSTTTGTAAAPQESWWSKFWHAIFVW